MPGTMLLPIVISSLLCSVWSLIPPSSVCNQDTIIFTACKYGNLSVAVTGKTYRPKDCNSHIDVSEIEHPPFIYINTTNATERFTMVMLDQGVTGQGPPYLQWMLTNVSVNTLPDYANSMAPNDIVVPYEKPLLMTGMPSPHLIQILIFRHNNTLRVPFGELWISRRQNFQFSQLYSNTGTNLRLCGPVAGIQFWVHDAKTVPPAGPMPVPGYIPVVPVVPVGHPGYYPPAAQPPYQPPPTHFPQKPNKVGNSANVLDPFNIFVLLALCRLVLL